MSLPLQRSIVTFHIGRSGSRVLGKLLGQHSELDWAGEALKTPTVEAFRAKLPEPGAYDTFDHLATLSEQRTKPWLGIEVKFFHLAKSSLTTRDFVERIAAMGCEHFVVLQRQNVLRKIVSSMVAKTNREYHRKASSKPELTRITIDPARVEIDAESKPLLDFLDSYQASFDELATVLDGKNSLELSYEDDIFEDPRHASTKVCEFANIAPHAPDIPFGKTNPFPLSEIITNFDEVQAHLSSTPYHWMGA